jgi:hypothetical protein
MEQIECSETSAYKIQTPGNHPEENIQHTEHGESLKSKIFVSSIRANVWLVFRHFTARIILDAWHMLLFSLCNILPIPVIARSKAWAFGRSLARIVG